jgi:hypothetical protein
VPARWPMTRSTASTSAPSATPNATSLSSPTDTSFTMRHRMEGARRVGSASSATTLPYISRRSAPPTATAAHRERE